MSAGLDVFRIIAPELVAIADVDVEAVLTVAARRHTPVAWGVVFADAMAEYAAHMLTLSPPGGASTLPSVAGPVTSRKAGGLAESYGAPSTSAATSGEAWLLRTSHGQAYIHLRDTRAEGAPTHLAP